MSKPDIDPDALDPEALPPGAAASECPQVRTTYRPARGDRKACVLVAIMLPDDDTRLEISINGERLFRGDEEC